jgi:gas vesicle protein
VSMNYQTSDDPEVIRAEIERTRSELSRDVNALGESVTPGNMARKGADKVKGRAVGLKDQIMGSASDAGHSTSQTASSLTSSVGDATHGAASTVKRQARGNPLAAGLVALGAGWLLGSLLPASDKEQRMAEAVKDRAAPVLDEAQSTVKQVAQESAENLKQPAQDAVQSVKEHAQESVETVKQEGQSAAQDVSSSAKSHADEAGATSGS